MRPIFALFVLLCGCGLLEHDGGQCSPGEKRCSPSSWTVLQECGDNQQWADRVIAPMLCINGHMVELCEVECDEGTFHEVGGELWLCIAGDACAEPYYQRR